MTRLARLLAGALLLVAGPLGAQEPLPIFDAHAHYNLETGRPVSVEEVFSLWHRAGIRAALLTSRPNEGTRELLARTPPGVRTVAFARPYVVRSDVNTWFRDPARYRLLETELARGIYVGIGEFHIFGQDADSEGFARVVALAMRRGLWLHAHCDDYVIARIYALDPGARVIWAHTGMTVALARVAQLLDAHPGLHGELSYRSGLPRAGDLPVEWRALFLRHPDRFLLGSDTWVPERWPEVPAIMEDYRRWLAQLPAPVAMQIAWGNGARLFLGGADPGAH